MTDNLHVQIALKAAPGDILGAWTAALPQWFAEHADVSIAEKRYDFWGRYTPGAPDRENGQHPLLAYEPDKVLQFGWKPFAADSVVRISIHERGGECVVVVQHERADADNPEAQYTDEDFWFLTLENLRRYLDGKPPVRCDYTQPAVGDVRHTVEIDAPRADVFAALIKPDQLQRWIASQATVEAHVGGRYDLGWGPNFGALKILEIVPDESLRLLSPGMDGRESIVHWTLEGSGGKTRLTLVHSGFAPDEPSDVYTGWLNFMSWVKSLTEYGPTWKPAITRLKPGTESFYPASVSAGQAELVS